MDLQVLSRGYNDSVFPKAHKAKKPVHAIKGHKNYFHNIDGYPSKSNYKKNAQNVQYKPHADHYDRYMPQAYPSWNVFSAGYPSKRNYGQDFTKFDDQHNRSNYVKNFQPMSNKDFFNDKASRSTGPSDNENGADVFSELLGFRIVHNGKIIHDETNQDFDSSSGTDSDSEEIQKEAEKFASSELTIGPNARDISIPSFADE